MAIDAARAMVAAHRNFRSLLDVVGRCVVRMSTDLHMSQGECARFSFRLRSSRTSAGREMCVARVFLVVAPRHGAGAGRFPVSATIGAVSTPRRQIAWGPIDSIYTQRARLSDEIRSVSRFGRVRPNVDRREAVVCRLACCFGRLAVGKRVEARVEVGLRFSREIGLRGAGADRPLPGSRPESPRESRRDRSVSRCHPEETGCTPPGLESPWHRAPRSRRAATRTTRASTS